MNGAVRGPRGSSTGASSTNAAAMGYMALFGYLLIGLGPALVFFSTQVAHRSFLVVLTFTR